jgi:hypothetical protein
LSDTFPIQNGLKQGAAFITKAFNSALEYAIRKVPENQLGLKLNGTYKLLLYADQANLFRCNVNIIKKRREAVIDASKEVGLEVNAEKTMHMLLSCQQNAGQNQSRCFENLTEIKYFRTAVKNHNFIHRGNKKHMKLCNACYHSVQTFLSSNLLYKTIKLK